MNKKIKNYLTQIDKKMVKSTNDILKRKINGLVLRYITNFQKRCKYCKHNKNCKIRSLELYDDLFTIISNNFSPNIVSANIIKKMVEAGEPVILQVMNTKSMHPTIKYGDFFIINSQTLNKGDIAAYFDTDKIIIHRIKGRTKKGFLITQPDNKSDYCIKHDEIIPNAFIGSGFVLKSEEKLARIFKGEKNV